MKSLAFILFACCFLRAGATIHTVTVTDFQFSPSNLNVVVGDVIRWEWAQGIHNSVSLVVPSGAAPWNSPELSATGSAFFTYTVTAIGSYQYECAYHSGFMNGSFTASAIVPVTLSFFGIANQADRPRISWTTEQESNSDYFAIRRSYDGAIFTEIGRVPAAGQSFLPRNYFFIDANVTNNVKYVYYEIVITDKDGSTQLSPIKLFKNNDRVRKLITSISPNPVQAAGHLMIQYNADLTGKLLARVIDMNGKGVLNKELYSSVGVNSGHIHLGDLASGNYIVQFSLNGVTESHKIRKR
jgi:plastocyanin